MSHKYKEKHTKHHIAAVTEDVVKQADSSKWVGASKADSQNTLFLQPVSCLPASHKYKEEYAKHHIATVTEDVVKRADSSQWMGTGKVVVTYVLVTCHVQDLEK